MRALALFLVSLWLGVIGPSVLIGMPFALLVLFLPVERWTGLFAGAIAAFLVMGGVREGAWFVDRGWALLVGGWFVALTLRWPASPLVTRAVVSVGGAAGAAGVILALRPGSWSVLDWTVGDRIRVEFTRGLSALESVGLGTPEVSENLRTILEAQILVFPATTALASAAGLGVAWWLYGSLARTSPIELAPVRDFDFSDHLVWLLVAGLALLLLGESGWGWRLGWNTVLFMGALYALRGAAIVMTVSGTISWLWVAPLALAAVFLWPIIAASAAVIGLGDTWLHIREETEAEEA